MQKCAVAFPMSLSKFSVFQANDVDFVFKRTLQ